MQQLDSNHSLTPPEIPEITEFQWVEKRHSGQVITVPRARCPLCHRFFSLNHPLDHLRKDHNLAITSTTFQKKFHLAVAAARKRLPFPEPPQCNNGKRRETLERNSPREELTSEDTFSTSTDHSNRRRGSSMQIAEGNTPLSVEEIERLAIALLAHQTESPIQNSADNKRSGEGVVVQAAENRANAKCDGVDGPDVHRVEKQESEKRLGFKRDHDELSGVSLNHLSDHPMSTHNGDDIRYSSSTSIEMNAKKRRLHKCHIVGPNDQTVSVLSGVRDSNNTPLYTYVDENVPPIQEHSTTISDSIQFLRGIENGHNPLDNSARREQSRNGNDVSSHHVQGPSKDKLLNQSILQSESKLSEHQVPHCSTSKIPLAQQVMHAFHPSGTLPLNSLPSVSLQNASSSFSQNPEVNDLPRQLGQRRERFRSQSSLLIQSLLLFNRRQSSLGDELRCLSDCIDACLAHEKELQDDLTVTREVLSRLRGIQSHLLDQISTEIPQLVSLMKTMDRNGNHHCGIIPNPNTVANNQNPNPPQMLRHSAHQSNINPQNSPSDTFPDTSLPHIKPTVSYQPFVCQPPSLSSSRLTDANLAISSATASIDTETHPPSPTTSDSKLAQQTSTQLLNESNVNDSTLTTAENTLDGSIDSNIDSNIGSHIDSHIDSNIGSHIDSNDDVNDEVDDEESLESSFASCSS